MLPSMGELEQLVPIMQRLLEQQPDTNIICSIFSASAIQHAQRLECIHLCLFLPIDSRSNMRLFFDALSPSAVIIDRYDVWKNFILECSRRKIPTLLLNATAPSFQHYIVRNFFSHIYKNITNIVAVSENHAQQLSFLVNKPIYWLPDTRIDRVLDVLYDVDESIASFKKTICTTIVVGSSWPEEEKLFSTVSESLQHAQIENIYRASCSRRRSARTNM